MSDFGDGGTGAPKAKPSKAQPPPLPPLILADHNAAVHQANAAFKAYAAAKGNGAKYIPLPPPVPPAPPPPDDQPHLHPPLLKAPPAGSKAAANAAANTLPAYKGPPPGHWKYGVLEPPPLKAPPAVHAVHAVSAAPAVGPEGWPKAPGPEWPSSVQVEDTMPAAVCQFVCWVPWMPHFVAWLRS